MFGLFIPKTIFITIYGVSLVEDPIFKILACLQWIGGCIVCHWPLPLVCTFLIGTYCLGTLKSQLEAYNHLVQGELTKERTTEGVMKLVLIGLHLYRHIHRFARAFGMFIMVDMALCTFALVSPS